MEGRARGDLSTYWNKNYTVIYSSSKQGRRRSKGCSGSQVPGNNFVATNDNQIRNCAHELVLTTIKIEEL